MKYLLTLFTGLFIGYQFGFKDSTLNLSAKKCYTTGPFTCGMVGENVMRLTGYNDANKYVLLVAWESIK